MVERGSERFAATVFASSHDDATAPSGMDVGLTANGHHGC